MDQDQQNIDNYFSDLLKNIKRSFNEREKKLIYRALEVAYDAHKGQNRKSGEPYITHPIAVAEIIANEIGFGAQSVACALLHDVVEDSDKYSLEDIHELFGAQIEIIVKGLSKIKKAGEKKIIEDESENEFTSEQLKTLVKVVTSSTLDIRVIYIKIADRLHNMRTLGSMNENTQMRKIGENMFFYAPFAYRLGLYVIKKELEDLSFKYRARKEYEDLVAIIEEEEKVREPAFQSVKRKIKEKLKSENLTIKVEFFKKSYYSTWKKMDENKTPFDEINNFRCIRVIFNSISDSSIERRIIFQLYAEISSILSVVPDSWKDFTHPKKQNGFQAFIFNVVSRNPNFIEIQIMSERMRRINDYGPLSVKTKSRPKHKTENEIWINNLTQQLRQSEGSALEFIQNLNVQFLSEIIVYSPKSQPFRFPRGSTILDFAFAIHTELAMRITGAYMNSDFVSIYEELKPGARIYIESAEKITVNEGWLEHVKTKKARDSIKSYLNKQKVKEINIGKEIFNQIVKDSGIEDSKLLLEKLLYKYSVTKSLFYKQVADNIIPKKDLYRTINQHTISLNKGFFQNLFKRTNKQEFLPIESQRKIEKNKKYPLNPALIYSEFFLAHCCNPLPGDDAVIIKNNHNVKIIHKKNCKAASHMTAIHGLNSAVVEWVNVSNLKFPAKIHLHGMDRKGILNELTSIITESFDINIYMLNVKSFNRTRFSGEIILFVSGKTHLNKLIDLLKKIDGIERVDRIDKFDFEA